jgi:acetyl esterase/lipase
MTADRSDAPTAVGVRLHPDCEEVLRRVAAWEPPAGVDDVEAMRVGERWRVAELAGTGEHVHEVRPVAIPAGRQDIPAVAYRPTADVAAGVLVWLHGGGFVVGSPAAADYQARGLARASGCVVLTVDYRLAPEHRFPAGLEDALTAVRWAAEHAESLGARRRIAVGGDSAGGNLAAAVALMARDQGGPQIDFQVMIYATFGRDVVTASRQRLAEGYWLTAEWLNWCWEQYLERDEDATNPYASPLLAESLAGLPPALIVVAECDVLHDEGELYAERLRQDGVSVSLVRYEGMLHGFIACAAVVGEAGEALRAIGQEVGDGLRLEAEPRPTGGL